MKKILIISALIFSFAANSFAQTILPKHVAPECTKDKYPNLYSTWHESSYVVKNDTVVRVCMTVPLKNVIRLNDSTFAIIHPVFNNECKEVISVVKDSDMGALATMTTYSPERIEKIAVTIKQTLLCGAPTGDWRIVGSTHSN